MNEAFNGGDAGGSSTFFAGVINEITPHFQPCSMGLSFVVVDIIDKAAICWPFVYQDLVLRYESHCVCTRWYSGNCSTDETSHLVDKGSAPDCCYTDLHQMAVLKRSSSVGVENSVYVSPGLPNCDDLHRNGILRPGW